MLIKSKNKNQLKKRNLSKYFKILKNKSSKILFLVFYSIILISVTYGAGGSTRKNTHHLVKEIKNKTSLEPAAHLTCIGTSFEEIEGYE